MDDRRIKLKKFFKSKIGSWAILAVLALSLTAYNYFVLGADEASGRIISDGTLYARFFDVGQGDATLLVMPDGSDVLVDGGPDGGIVPKLKRTLPGNDRVIELVVLTHPHLDHLYGLLEILKNYQVKEVLTAGVRHDTISYKEWERALKEENIKITAAAVPEVFNFGGAEIKVLAPEQDLGNSRIVRDLPGEGGGLNDTSIVLLVDYGENEILLMGDAGEEIEKKIMDKFDLRADILKVGHHGSKYSSGAEFVKEVSPAYAVISSGAGNKYGHPHFRTLRTLSRAAAAVYRTDTDGTVTAHGDGRTWEVWPENARSAPCKIKIPVLKWLLCRN
ncbi:MBL fold metallo-hydrolase [Candidatus Uhrbacteria bacterium]|nr:MBL fold metallo-hydrolase [Candidatus Uhrbacteria bacterium]